MITLTIKGLRDDFRKIYKIEISFENVEKCEKNTPRIRAAVIQPPVLDLSAGKPLESTASANSQLIFSSYNIILVTLINFVN